MTDKIIDASAFAAVTYQEAEEQIVLARLRGHDLHAPTLLRFEMANIYLKKVRRHSAQRDVILAQHIESQRTVIHERAVDQLEACELAERFNLSAYDASYLWLARDLGAELVTLDARLERAAAAL